MSPIKDWPHAPIHRISSDGIYMVTGATLHKEHLFPTVKKLDMLERELLDLAKKHKWQFGVRGNLLPLWSPATCHRRPRYTRPPHFYKSEFPHRRPRQIADDQSADTGVPSRAARLGWL